TWMLNSGHVHYLIQGAGHVYAVVDSHAMINGPLHGELLKEVSSEADSPRWVSQDLSAYAGHRVHVEFAPNENKDFRVLMVVEGSQQPSAPTKRSNSFVKNAVTSGNADATSAACRELILSTLDLLAADRIAQDAEPQDRAALANWLISQRTSASASPAI